MRQAASLALLGSAAFAAPEPARAATLADLANEIADELERDCRPGSRIAVAPDALVLNPDNTVTAHLARFTCPWTSAAHPLCAPEGCEIRLYRWTGIRFELLGARLQ